MKQRSKRIMISVATAVAVIIAVGAAVAWHLSTRLPEGLVIPAGWTVVKVRHNPSPSFEDTYWYVRLRSPDSPKSSVETMRKEIFRWQGSYGESMKGAEPIPAAELATPWGDPFALRHMLDRSRYTRGWKITCGGSPRFIVCYAFEDNGGSVLELISFSSL